MNINLDAYQVFMIITASFGAFFGLARYIAKQAIDNINEKFEELKSIREDVRVLTQNIVNTERDLLKIKLDTAQQYVRKDDFIRLEKHITDELRALGVKIDNFRERRANP